jgi:hypothetical protein
VKKHLTRVCVDRKARSIEVIARANTVVARAK